MQSLPTGGNLVKSLQVADHKLSTDGAHRWLPLEFESVFLASKESIKWKKAVVRSGHKLNHA